MHAVVFHRAKEVGRMDVKDRFDLEDSYLRNLVPSRPCSEYVEHQPSPKGIHVFIEPVSQDFEARPYLEFTKQILNETHFHVMQEGRPTGFTVILG